MIKIELNKFSEEDAKYIIRTKWNGIIRGIDSTCI